MQTEIDAEKEEGLGVPVEVTNQVAQAQMVGQVDTENQVALAKAMPAEPAQGGNSGGSSTQSKSESKPKPKSDSKPVKGDLSLKESTFDVLKRII